MQEENSNINTTRVVKSVEDVETYLKRAKSLLQDSSTWIINNQEWNGRTNKTLQYMTRTNINENDIAQVINKLDVCNYCYTDDDRNANFPNEKFWFFGITDRIIDTTENYYIKLKIRQLEHAILLVMSFHPETPNCEENKLTFPYKEK